ncbi:MAG: hypothetical protein JO022_22360, partial [Acidobacteriaceae bacterium]|nr:hypothetical protein [Acidobacteriaceae bacterium]
MKYLALTLLTLGVSSYTLADDIGLKAWELEAKGDAAGAKALLQKEAAGASASADALRAYAEFLDRHHDPGTRAVYERLLNASTGASRASAARRLVLLDVYAEDESAAAKHLVTYQDAGGRDFTLPSHKLRTPDKKQTITIPGPLRSFARMAALSPDVNPDELLAALGRNVVTNGYQATASNEALEQTEYLKLVVRYLTQARELDKLSGAEHQIKIESCE